MPWVHFHVTQFGSVTPCCQAPWQEEHAFGNINKQSMAAIWRGEKIKAFRKSILDGKVDKRCEACFMREKEGFTSLRKITNHKYRHKQDLVLKTTSNGEIGNAPPVYFDIRFSNICNLKCRICGPWSSSSWFNDALQLGMIKKDAKALTYAIENTQAFLGEFSGWIDSLEELYFAGGEPLVMDEHYELLTALINAGKTDVRLTYNTNFSSLRYKDYDIIEIWKGFKTISIAASLDASGKRGEFLRKNIRWADVLENRRLLMRELPQVEFVVSPTLNAYNLLHLPDFHTEWVAQGFIQVEDFIPTLLVTPRDLSVLILPSTYKRLAIKKYTEHLKWARGMPWVNALKREYMLTQFENIIKALNAAEDKRAMELFRKSSVAADNVRGERTLEIFPELKELFKV